MHTFYLKQACLFFFVVFTFCLGAEYAYNPAVSQSKWKALKPYFLPEDHPAKAKLDKIFRKRVILNKESLLDADFNIVKLGKPRRPKIVSHPSLDGYLLKLYFDNQLDIDETHNFMKRIQGAELAKEIIEENNLEDFFVVPGKWLYPLPLSPLPPNSNHYEQKNFVLIVDKINCYKREYNKECWRTCFTHELVFALYTLLEEGGYSDSTFVFNLPFTKDGKIAMIDTEIYNSWPINYNRLDSYFSREMEDYWISLTE